MRGTIQIGKQGLTENFIETLKSHFKKFDNVRISVLKSARGEGKEGKEDVRKMTEEILDKLGKNFTYRIIGFTIVLKKWRKPMR